MSNSGYELSDLEDFEFFWEEILRWNWMLSLDQG